MKKTLAVLSFVLFVVFPTLFAQRGIRSGQRGAQANRTPSSSTGVANILPSSLDAYYPPKAKEPVYLLRMMGLAAPMSGIRVGLQENELQKAMDDYAKFKAEYLAVSKLVPEWDYNFPAEAVDGLGRALQTGKQDAVSPAFESLDAACMRCHLYYMVRVQQKYHWPDFFAIKVKDPLAQAEIGGKTIMQCLDTNLAGVSVDLAEGRPDGARKQLQAFEARFQTLKKMCGECHGAGERKYYVDAGVQTMILQLAETLSAPSPDAQKVAPLVQGIGMESCHKCHLVHIPGAFSHFAWETLIGK